MILLDSDVIIDLLRNFSISPGKSYFATHPMDSGFRRNDGRSHPIVIPAKAGIQ